MIHQYMLLYCSALFEMSVKCRAVFISAGRGGEGRHTNIRQGPFPFLIHVASIFTGRALFSSGVHFSSPKKLTTFFSRRRYV